MVPPTNMLTPLTAFIFPDAGSSLRAGAPMRPMSAACTCAEQDAGGGGVGVWGERGVHLAGSVRSRN